MDGIEVSLQKTVSFFRAYHKLPADGIDIEQKTHSFFCGYYKLSTGRIEGNSENAVFLLQILKTV